MSTLRAFLLTWILSAPLAAQEACRIVGVLDGDTYTLLCRSRKILVRLTNVDAPESDQFYGMAAADSTRGLLLNQLVQTQFTGTDLYGRALVRMRWQGKRVDSLLIARGWAWHYTAYSDLPAMASVQLAARQAKLGLWACAQPVPPWIWRRLNFYHKRLYGLCR